MGSAPNFSHQQLLNELDYCPDCGTFRWKIHKANKVKPGSVAGNKCAKNYWRITFFGKHHYAHHIAWFHFYGVWPKGQIDHADGNGRNNSISNLRECTQSQNSANRKRSSHNRSGHKGVFWDKQRGKWCASVQSQRRRKRQFFDSIDEAKAAYAFGASLAFGEFAKAG